MTQDDSLEQLAWWAEETTAAHTTRNDWIRTARERGHSLRAIASAAQMSVEAVRRIAQAS